MSSSVVGDPTSTFFEDLQRRGHEPLLAGTRGTIRIDVRRGGTTEIWYLDISRGDVAVSHRDAPADAVIGTDAELLDEVVQGRTNAMAASLRGALTIEGDMELMIGLQRIFPGPTNDAGGLR